ncbi:transposase [Chroococcidiopsis sp. CCMEE 29]|uniref:RNA-guided endonuclease InsQ/TnpB family protein n=1 Tax=Chroococcidiopsis sp. CCMEE 29 TaxID=155894 RepID=UPI002021E238|nr:transposase [Chroococcidiopsis sp. CCMEE 29]
MKARYRYRIYPKPQQIQELAKAFGCARVVWNDALALYDAAFKAGETRPKDVDKIVITQAKKTPERAWLSEVSNIVLQQSYRDLSQAWSNYFNSCKGKRKGAKVRKPRFKKKQARQAIRFRTGGFSVHSCSVKLAKIGHIPMVVSRPLPSEPSSVTMIKDAAGRYFASFVVEAVPQPVAKVEAAVGIDLGLNHFAILSTGEKIENPRCHKKLLKRIKLANRKLSRCQKDSNRRKVAKLKLAKLYCFSKDSRTDFLHKLTTRLVRENQALAIEDLNVSGMVKNRKLSRAISDAGWYSFRSLLTAKCDRDGRHVAIINRWEATSQKCSVCGFHGGKKELHVRSWECLSCGTIHDRDTNAANNIKVAAGLAETQNGCGSECKTTSVAVRVEPSTTLKSVQLSLF